MKSVKDKEEYTYYNYNMNMLLYSLRKKLDLLWCVFKVQPYIVAIHGLDAIKHSRDY